MTVSEWVAANPATVHVIVVSVFGLLSLAYNAVKDSPRVAAAIKVLSAVGIDVPKLLEGVSELLDPVKVEAKEEPKPPVGPALAILFAAVVASTQSGCTPSWTSKDGAELADHGAILARCQAEGDDAAVGQHIKTYDACLKDAGVK